MIRPEPQYQKPKRRYWGLTALGADGEPIWTVQADEKGEIIFKDLALGDSRFTVVAAGFQKRPLTVTLRNGDEIQVETELEVGFIGEIVTIRRRPWWRRIFH